jgi:hypothetical protein
VIYSESNNLTFKGTIMNTKMLDMLIELEESLGGDSPIMSLSTMQEKSSDGSFHVYITSQSYVVSYDEKVYLFPKGEHAEHADKTMIPVLAFMFTGDISEHPELVEKRKTLKVIHDSPMFRLLQIKDGFFDESRSVNADDIASINEAVKAKAEVKTLH